MSLLTAVLAAVLLGVAPDSAAGQHALPAAKQTPLPWPAPLDSKPPFELSAELRQGWSEGEVYLIVRAQLAPGHAIYSLTQPEGLATTLEVALDDDWHLAGPFRTNQPPTRITMDPVLGIPVEKHTDHVEFYLPLQRRTGRPTGGLVVAVRVNGQVCSDEGVCLPIRNLILHAR